MRPPVMGAVSEPLEMIAQSRYVRFTAHNGLWSDIAACLKSAMKRRMSQNSRLKGKNARRFLAKPATFTGASRIPPEDGA
jgi:hypothetical protein